MKAETVRKRINDQVVAATGRRVLLVEGPDDVAALRLLLDRKIHDWETKWALEPADGKANVLKIAPEEPNWLCLVDRDEVSDNEAASQLASNRNLVLLPRFCIESYLCVPAEIWPAVEAAGTRKITDNFAQFEGEVLQGLGSWRRHAALWHVVNPLWKSLMSAGFNNALLEPANVPDDTALLTQLQSWAAVLDPGLVFRNFQAEDGRVQTLALVDFLHTKLHAKRFYEQAVNPVLIRWLGQADSSQRKNDLFKHIAIPADLDPLWSRLAAVS